MSERDFWRCSVPAFFRMIARFDQEQARRDWRAYFAALGARLEKIPKPAEAFPSLVGLGSGGGGSGYKREDFPPDWKITLGSEGGQQLKALVAADNMRRMAARRKK